MDAPETVAVINTSPDIVDMLRVALEHAGVVVVSALTHEIRDGQLDVESFIQQHDPKVVVYDVAPPYEANWRLFEHIAQLPALRKRQFVMTSTNAPHVEKLARGTRIFEILGKPYDIDQIVDAVRQALKSRWLD
jgi:DNA-binding NtrC family response regulator